MEAVNPSNNIQFLLFLQRHFFSCKEHFDIKTINSTYTQVSTKIFQLVKEACLSLLVLYFDRSFLVNLIMLFVPRWRARVFIRPWGS